MGVTQQKARRRKGTVTAPGTPTEIEVMETLPAATNGTQHATAPIVAAQSVFAPLTARDLAARAKLIEDAIGSVLKESMHFGKIDGCGDKPTLLKPGAEKLCCMFGYRPELQIKLTELPNGHREYTITATLRDPYGNFAGQGIGSCSTMESKYRWRKAGRKCPKCGKEAIKVSKYEDGGFYCFNKIGGCGAKFGATDASIVSQVTGRVENEDIADTYNTCLKMAKKRALVDATLTATAASDIFTQDIEDLQDIAITATAVHDEPAPQPKPEPPKTPLKRPGVHPSIPLKAPPHKASAENDAMAEKVILEARIHKMASAFSDIGVRMGQLEEYIGNSLEKATEKDVDELQGVYRDIKAAPAGEEREKLIAQFFAAAE